MPTITQPTTIAEMRRLANAFLSGSRYPADTEVYVVMSKTGLMPIFLIIPITEDGAGAAAEALMVDPTKFTYQVKVPATVTALNPFLLVKHGATTCSLVERRGASAAPPANPVLGTIKSSSIHITWPDDSTSIYDLDDKTDAVFLTRGAVEMFAFTAYQAMYGSEYLAAFKESLV